MLVIITISLTVQRPKKKKLAPFNGCPTDLLQLIRMCRPLVSVTFPSLLKRAKHLLFAVNLDPRVVCFWSFRGTFSDWTFWFDDLTSVRWFLDFLFRNLASLCITNKHQPRPHGSTIAKEWKQRLPSRHFSEPVRDQGKPSAQQR